MILMFACLWAKIDFEHHSEGSTYPSYIVEGTGVSVRGAT